MAARPRKRPSQRRTSGGTRSRTAGPQAARPQRSAARPVAPGKAAKKPAAGGHGASAGGAAGAPFGPGLLHFLGALAANNTRAWFQAHADEYEAHVREPALAFIRAFRAPLRRISPHFLAEDRKVGGSLMRIHRDVRFSKDKSPYKTNLGIQFRHEAGKDVHAPGIYLHVEPGQAFLGVGMWHPEPEALAAVRRALVADPRGWRRACDPAPFRAAWTLEGDRLKRPPQGFDPGHPLLEDLKRKDHIAVHAFPPTQVAAPDFVDWMAARIAEARPYLRWLTRAVGLPA